MGKIMYTFLRVREGVKIMYMLLKAYRNAIKKEKAFFAM
jgi:hypothetical protein